MGEGAGASKEAAERVRCCVEGEAGDGREWGCGKGSGPEPLPSPPHPRSALRSLRGGRGCRSPQRWKHHQAGETRWRGSEMELPGGCGR